MTITVTPYNAANPAFKNRGNENKYSDPLMKWPARGLAYTNELGAALSEIAPKIGLMLWVPALLYFGADIYDKYKNEKVSYDPNAQRGTQEAIFQLLASVILPTAAVKLGQKTASIMGTFSKTGLSLQSQEEIINFTQGFIGRRRLENYTDKKDEFKNHFKKSLATKRENLIRENKFKKPLRAIWDSLFGNRHPETLAMSKEDRVLSFAERNIDDLFKVYSDLMQNKKPKNFTNKMWKQFNKLKTKFAKDPDYKESFLTDAADDIIRKYQHRKITKHKMLKTIGGFVALGLAIKPIDNFVENFVIRKVVEPKLNNVFKQEA